ncbi:p-loop containing nucleoside triphosphate hydrolase protein [Diaporthe amygdali]|uniref:p-loop containing nucleoside triphosphate hydrolase protein n=1 Tax=Phomopsis amygdali TaxID=1214568 RepID=UPI0022FEE9FA|nr:p-loop containing nucleoside triphosphate hydrolase protein [Diaporthe amygdali]KAJ0103724.1 p-loop containing nucleoside triphosphate hydrolase protein [Diaporthe amygdali]
MHGDIFDIKTITRQLVPLIRQYGPACTAILAPSIRANVPLSMLTNQLSGFYGLPVAVSISDEVSLDEHVIAGKICVSTFHQFKGNERELVIVYGADAGYFKFLGSDLPDDRCPNSIFVGLTRALKQLVVMHDHQQRPMPFINEDQLHQTAQYLNFSETKMQDTAAIGRPLQSGLLLPKNVHASLAARHVPVAILDVICKTHLDIILVAPPLAESHHIAAPDKALTDAAKLHYEAVSVEFGSVVVVKLC